MRFTMTAAALLTLATAACGDNRNASPPNATAASTGNAVAALSEAQRNIAFIRAIRDAGLECQHVESSSPAGTYRGMPVWRATCQGNRIWTIVLGNDNNAQILNAAEANLITDAASNSAR